MWSRRNRCFTALPVSLLLALAFVALPSRGPAQEPAPEASLSLGDQAGDKGLRILTEEVEQRLEVVTRGGREAVVSLPATPGVATSGFMYVVATQEAFRNGAMPGLAIRVEYFDAGTGTIDFQYDSSDALIRLTREAVGAFKSGKPIYLEDTGTWKTVTLTVADAQFSGRCHGGDFRFTIPAGGSFAVGSMVVTAAVTGLAGALPRLRWRHQETAFPTTDGVVAGYTVAEFGAKGDGVSDDTVAFQMALDAMAAAGGGTVFAPAGRYALRGNLTIPVSVTLRGEWAEPTPGRPLVGTVLQAYAGRGRLDGEPFISITYCAGLKDLAIWYPEQVADAIVPYPYCIKDAKGFGDNYTIENVTLVNPYQGIRFGPDFNELFYIKQVYGTPLAVGLRIENISDIGRIEWVRFNPDFWSDSGLPGAPAKGGPHAQWMYANGTGFRLYRVDWNYAAFLDIRGYRTGMETFSSDKGAPNGQVYGSSFTGFQTALRLVETLEPGFGFTHCVFEGEVGIQTEAAFSAALFCHSCTIQGSKAAASLGGKRASATLFQDCSFAGTVTRQAGNAVFLGCAFSATGGDHLVLESEVNAASVAGARFDGPPRFVNRSASTFVTLADEPLPASRLPRFAYPGTPVHTPSRVALYVVTDAAFGARKDGTSDDTEALQRALDTAARDGGGTVFLPGGIYCVRGHLSVPPNVELRGVHDVPHHPMGKGSTLALYAGRGEASGAPAIVLRERSGIRGMTCYYPEQRQFSEVPYPPTLQGRGAGVYVINTTVMNPYFLADFASYRCDDHYLDFVAGAPLRTGIRVGAGARNGQVRNAMFNPHYWWRSPYPDSLATVPGNDIFKAAVFQYANLEAFVFGDCENELQFQNFNFAARIGLHFITENGKGASGLVLGHGTDGSLAGIVFDGLGAAGLTLVNTQCDVYNPDRSSVRGYFETGRDFAGEVTLYNTSYWGGNPQYSVLAQAGTIRFELGHFNLYAAHRAAGGRIELTNVYLDRNAGSDPAFALGPGGSIQTRGCLLDQPYATGGTVDSRFDARSRDCVQLPDDATTIAVTLSNPQQIAGLSLMETGAESNCVPVTRAGRAAWVSLKELPGKTYFLYYRIEFPGFRDGKAPQVKMAVDYFDEGTGSFDVRYDSSDATITVYAATPGAWKTAGLFQLTDTKTWKTYECTVSDAVFAGRCNGGDLRFDVTGANVPPAVGSVRISRAE
jgi:hypothetical protein